MSGTQTQTRRADGKPETAADKQFFDWRAGYTGPVDQDDRKVTRGRAADMLDAMQRRCK